MNTASPWRNLSSAKRLPSPPRARPVVPTGRNGHETCLAEMSPTQPNAAHGGFGGKISTIARPGRAPFRAACVFGR